MICSSRYSYACLQYLQGVVVFDWLVISVLQIPSLAFERVSRGRCRPFENTHSSKNWREMGRKKIYRVKCWNVNRLNFQSPLLNERPGAPFSKAAKRFRPDKPFVKLRHANSVKLVFTNVVKGIKIKITAKFRAS